MDRYPPPETDENESESENLQKRIKNLEEKVKLLVDYHNENLPKNSLTISKYI